MRPSTLAAAMPSSVRLRRRRAAAPRRTARFAPTAAGVALCAVALGALPPLCAAVVYVESPLVNNMPCSSYTCPTGYALRWNAAQTFCQHGACGANDTQACCTQGQFFSYGWRILAGAVTQEWEVRRIRFYADDNCTSASQVTTAPGMHGSRAGWPNGVAFSHRYGHGGTANLAFVADPTPTPRTPNPTRRSWVSSGPCQVGACFVGFRWEGDTDRFPLGKCTPTSRSGCAVESKVKRASSLRIGCAQVEQSATAGRYAAKLSLQLLDTSAAGSEVWRTAADADNLVGGLAQLKIL